jgi:hypothetical protein
MIDPHKTALRLPNMSAAEIMISDLLICARTMNLDAVRTSPSASGNTSTLVAISHSVSATPSNGMCSLSAGLWKM